MNINYASVGAGMVTWHDSARVGMAAGHYWFFLPGHHTHLVHFSERHVTYFGPITSTYFEMRCNKN